MKKEEYIRRYGAGAYERMQQQNRDRARVRDRKWRRDKPEEVKVLNHEICRKGGKYYKHYREYQLTGIRHERNLVRQRHATRYQQYKQIIAPESQIHHEWIPETAGFRGVALVEKEQHQHGFIDVIRILEGEITLLTEEEIRTGGIINYE